jgi:hypothetical protein
MIFILSLFILTTSCGDIKNRIKIKNTEWWIDKGIKGAKSFNTLNNHTREWDQSTWDKNRFGYACGAPEAIGEILSEIEQFCNTFENCDYETQNAVNAIVRRYNYVNQIMNSQYTPLKEVNLINQSN